MRNYKRLDIEEFGRHLLESGDLDPVYIALPKAVEDAEQRDRWLVAYWCFYSAGFASWASEIEGRDFWKALATAAVNTEPTPFGGRWPRGHERRHARGVQGLKMVEHLRERYLRPSNMVSYLSELAPSYEVVAGRAQEHVLFGPWISFKICDMIDRVLDVHVDFSEAAVFMFDDPVKAALMLWRRHNGLPETARPKDQTAVIHAVVEHLKGVFKEYTAPPLHDRLVGLQEVETILCKWKSHCNGHYPLWNDVDEINEGLAPWAPHSATARSFAHHMPKREGK